IDMDRQILDRIELEVARNHAVFRSLDLDIVERGEKASRINALTQIGMLEQHQHRGLAVTINHARHLAGATRIPGGPLAALRTRRRLHFPDGRHDILVSNNGKGGNAASTRSKPPGVPGAADGGFIAAEAAKSNLLA